MDKSFFESFTTEFKGRKCPKHSIENWEGVLKNIKKFL